MPATKKMVARGRVKPLLAVLLLIGLVVGLTGCRAFFRQAPIALLTVTVPADDHEVPVKVTVDISGSEDPDGTIISYEIDFGDGSPIVTGTDVTAAISHTYMVAGTFTIILTVTDNDSRIGRDAVTVIIGPGMVNFASDRGGTFGIWRMEGDGSGLVVVRDDPAVHELFPNLVRGTRDRIVYAAEDGTHWNIRSMMAVDGLHDRPLTAKPASNQIQPSWSYDGTKIAFASNAAQTPSSTTWSIYAMHADGTNQIQLITQTPSWAPVFSPVNDDLIFVSSVRLDGSPAVGGSAIFKRTAAGLFSMLDDSVGRDGDASPALAGLIPLLDLPYGAGISTPAWNLDGTKIAFSTDRDAGVINIYVMSADGTGAQTLEAYVHARVVPPFPAGTITTGDHEFAPHWLEDGSGLAFARQVGAVINLYTVSFTTGAVRQIITTGRNVTPAQR